MVLPRDYFDDYPDEHKEELDVNERLKLWLEHIETFKLLLSVCPFPISKEAEEWLNVSI